MGLMGKAEEGWSAAGDMGLDEYAVVGVSGVRSNALKTLSLSKSWVRIELVSSSSAIVRRSGKYVVTYDDPLMASPTGGVGGASKVGMGEEDKMESYWLAGEKHSETSVGVVLEEPDCSFFISSHDNALGLGDIDWALR